MNKRTIAAWAMASLLVGCSSSSEQVKPYQESTDVTARLLRIDPVEPTESGATLEVVIRVKNDTIEPVEVKRLAIEVSLAGDAIIGSDPAPPTDPDTEEGAPGSGGDDEVEVEVYEGSASPGDTVAAGHHLDVPIRVHIDYPDSPTTFVGFCKLGVANIDVEGFADTSKGRVEFSDSGEIPTPTLPEPSAMEVQMATANNGESGALSMTLRLFNANVFSWKVRDWKYKVYVADKLMREATVGVGERIQPNTAIQYMINIPLDAKTFGPEVKRLLKSQVVPYRVEGTLRFGEVVTPTYVEGEVRFSR